MMKKSALSLLMLALAVMTMLPAAAHADSINFSFTMPVQTGAPGTTLTFASTIAAPSSNSGPVDLYDLSITTPGFTTSPVDDSGFFNNFPELLNPGASVTDTLFTIALASNIAPGTYIGTASILDAAGAQLGTSTFEIDVPGTSPVPEPGTWVLLITGAGALAGVVYSRSRSTASNLAA
jgi:hypothetical protein